MILLTLNILNTNNPARLVLALSRIQTVPMCQKQNKTKGKEILEMSSEKKTNKKIPKQRAIMYTQQMRLAILSDWKEEIDRIVKLLEPLL